MQDHDFEVLKVKAAICPQKDDWPSGDVQVSIAGPRPTIKGELYAGRLARLRRRRAQSRLADIWKNGRGR